LGLVRDQGASAHLKPFLFILLNILAVCAALGKQ